MNHPRWQLRPPPPPEALAALGPMPRLAAILLARRGITARSQVRPYLEGDSEVACDPFALPDMGVAVARLQEAVRRSELIAVYGDFDADGITASAVLVEGLGAVGLRAISYIPHRLLEGHGLRSEAIQELARRGASVLIAADCGTTSLDEIAFARGLGLDVIVADHHVPPPQPSPALALVNPHRPDSRYPSPELASVGIAVKLIEALYSAQGRGGAPPESLYELVALGTVADVAPLIGENRYLVKRGLAELNRTQRHGLRALLQMAGPPQRVDEETIGFALAPRINAAGRLDHARLAYDLLLAPSAAAAEPLARRLDDLNRQRQEQTAQILQEAEAQWAAQAQEEAIIIVGSPRFPAGLVGLAAGRLTEAYHRPAIVMELGATEVRASGRSIDEFNLVQSLHLRPELFLRYGGHAKAAGFTTTPDQLPALTAHLRRRAQEELADVELRASLPIEAEAELGELTPRIIALLRYLAPFGEGNRPPTFLTQGVQIVQARPLGAGGRHLRLKVRDGGAVWDAIGFGLGAASLASGQRADLVYTIASDNWNGESRVRLNLLDVRPQTG
ncbi:MAG: single-stranded-DNA-specific exonuclease RecJ [Dehalococcoidia bacterium]|nr:single-stranded-DNA-specific exonuclease RecJ [Dehalococcoidia bacterium]